MIRAFQKQIEDLAEIWGNKSPALTHENSDINYKPFQGDPEIYCAEALGFLKADRREYDLICLDPPYNMGGFWWDQFDSEEQYLGWCDEWLTLAFERLKDGGSFYSFGVFEMLRKISLLAEQKGFQFRDYIIWNHIQGTGGGLWVNRHEDILYCSRGEKIYQNRTAVTIEREPENVRQYGGRIYDYKNPSNIWEYPVLDNQSEERVTDEISQKPIALLERIVLGSCPPGGLAIDFFAGTGSFGIACMRHGIQCVLVEKEKTHIKFIHSRIERERMRNVDDSHQP